MNTLLSEDRPGCVSVPEEEERDGGAAGARKNRI